MTTTERQYLSCADTAKLLRSHLKRGFPGVKFSVRSHTYAGGASVDVSWTDGPTDAQVSAVTNTYSGARFDGMIDMASYVSHWLEADGTVTVAHDGGTEDQRGSRGEVFGSRRTADAVLVHLGANYVFTHRTESEKLRNLCATMVTHTGQARSEQCDGCGNWMNGPCHVAKTPDRFNEDRVHFVCSTECGGRLIARHVTCA